mgnify:CR=1 FL=1
MMYKWNIDPTDPVTIARLISELEGATYILECLDDASEELSFLNEMKKKYYKEYFKRSK